MSFKCKCGNCRQHILVEEAWAGQTVRCVRCGHHLIVPSASSQREAISASLSPTVSTPEPESTSAPPVIRYSPPASNSPRTPPLVGGLLLVIAALLSANLFLVYQIAQSTQQGMLGVQQIVQNTAPSAAKKVKWAYSVFSMRNFDADRGKFLKDVVETWGDLDYELVAVVPDLERSGEYKIFTRRRTE